MEGILTENLYLSVEKRDTWEKEDYYSCKKKLNYYKPWENFTLLGGFGRLIFKELHTINVLGVLIWQDNTLNNWGITFRRGGFFIFGMGEND